jgi:hypothetical protein
MPNNHNQQPPLFPEWERAQAQARQAPGDGAAAAPCILPLPPKPTCTPDEAARTTGLASVRQFRNWVEDGTLLAVDAARHAVSGKSIRASWRIVVRRSPAFDLPEHKHFLTLDELIRRASNLEKA